MKAGGDYTDDGSANIVQNHSLADDIFASSKFALPQAFCDHRRRVRAQPVFVGGECPSHDRVHPKNFKKARGDHFAMQPLRLSIAGEIEASGTISSHAGEGGDSSAANPGSWDMR